MRRWVAAALVAVPVVVCVLLLFGCSSSAPYAYRKIEVTNFSHGGLDALLRKYVDERGRVDYAAWRAGADDMRALDGYVNLIANASPESHPALFPTEREQLSYWINAYNALVLRAVLEHWPIESVTDVKSGVSFVRGQGFFANRKYLVGGRWLSLYELENERLRQQSDPRMHFAINCASGSCPVLRPNAYEGADLDKRLDQNGRAFVNQQSNAYVSHDRRTVYLSMIFKWYEADFLRAMNRPGADMLDYVFQFADKPLADDLAKARDGKYAIEHLEYDWTINRKR